MSFLSYLDDDPYTLNDATRVLPDDFMSELNQAIVRRLETGAGARLLSTGADPHLLTHEEVDHGFLILGYIDLTEILQVFLKTFRRSPEREVAALQNSLLATLQLAAQGHDDAVMTISAGEPRRVWILIEGTLESAAQILSQAAARFVYDCPPDIHERYDKDSLLFGFAELHEVASQMHQRRNYVLGEFPDTHLVDTVRRMMVVTAAKRLWRTKLMGDMVRVGQNLAGLPTDMWHEVMGPDTLRELNISLDVLYVIDNETVIALGQRGPMQAAAIDRCFDTILDLHREELTKILSGYEADPENERVPMLLDEWFAFEAIRNTAVSQQACVMAA